MSTLNKIESDKFQKLISETKGLSASGNRARATIHLNLSEVQKLQKYAKKNGMNITSALCRIVQENLK